MKNFSFPALSTLKNSASIASGVGAKIPYFVLAMAFILMWGCKKQKVDEGDIIRNQDINAYIKSLNYNPSAMLNEQATGGEPVTKELLDEQTSNSTSNGNKLTCTEKTYGMKSNFEEVAILRPTNGIIWPGALVRGDGSMLDGAPDPISLSQSAVNLRIDLPGIGDKGNLVVQDPNNSTVQSALDNALDWWNNNAYVDGYVSPSYLSYKTSSAYTAKQLSVDVGLNVEWAGNSVASQFNHTSSSTKKVAMMVFKQGFYAVTMNVPPSPAAIFGSGVSLEDVMEQIDGNSPAAFVHSVVYGRIIMFRMESSSAVSASKLELALNYAAGITTVSGAAEIEIKNILQNSTTTVVTIGGNAQAAAEAVSATNFGDLQNIIKGDNAVYKKDNPGVPIAYTIRYLKDNRLAKMGYTTEYTVKECTSALVPSKTIAVKNNTGPGADIGWDIRFTIKYTDKNGYGRTIYSDQFNPGTRKKNTVPAGAYNVNLEVEYQDGLAWKFLSSRNWSIPTYGCYEAYGSWELFGNKVPKFRSGNCGD